MWKPVTTEATLPRLRRRTVPGRLGPNGGAEPRGPRVAHLIVALVALLAMRPDRLPAKDQAGFGLEIVVALPPDGAELLEALARVESEGVFECFVDRDMGLILDRRLADDETRLRELLTLLPPGSVRSRAVRLVGIRLATRSARDGLAFLQEVSVADRPGAAEAVYATIASRSVDRAFAALAEERDPAAFPAALLATVMALKPDERGTADRLARDLPLGLRIRAWRHIAATWPVDGFASLVAWVDALPEEAARDMRVDMLALRFIDVVNERPDLAIAGFGQLPEDMRAERASHVAERVAERDLGVALAWMRSLEPQDSRSAALVGLLGPWCQADLAAAVATVSDWPDRAARPKLFRMTGWHWAKISAGDALAWARSLPDDVRPLATIAVLHRMTHDDATPRVRAEIMALAPGPERDGIFAALANNVSGGDWHAAADWAAGYPDAVVAARGVRAMAREWTGISGQNIAKVEQWIAAAADGALRDAARAGAVDALAEGLLYPKPDYRPQPLVRLVAAIEAPDLRRTAAQQACAAWARAFPADDGLDAIVARSDDEPRAR